MEKVKLSTFLPCWGSLFSNEVAIALLLSMVEGLQKPQVRVAQHRWPTTKGVFVYTLLMPQKICYFYNYRWKSCLRPFSSFYIIFFLSPRSTKKKIQNSTYFNMQSYPLRVTKHPNQINGSKTWNRLHHVTKTVQDRAGFKETWVQRLKQWLRWESPWLGSGSSVVAPHLGSMWKTAVSSPDIRCSSTVGKKDYLFQQPSKNPRVFLLDRP